MSQSKTCAPSLFHPMVARANLTMLLGRVLYNESSLRRTCNVLLSAIIQYVDICRSSFLY